MANIKTDVVNILKDVEIFSEFDNEILVEFSNSMTEVFLNKGETLFNKGDQENAMYVILDGSVEVHDNYYIFTTLNSKQFFGEYSLIDSALRSASVTAVRETHLLELKQNTFEQVTSKNPELWKNVLIPLIKRLRDYNIIEEKLTMRTIDIQKKNHEVEQEKENIATQKKELEAINATKDKFFTIIGHDLKNPFSTVIGITDLLLNNFVSLEEEEKLKNIRQINRFSKNAYNMLDNLLLWARSQTGSLKINFKRANLKNIIDNITELFSINSSQKSISLNSHINSEFHGYIDVDMISTVVRNLVSNAFKFTTENGTININAIEVGDMLQIEVADTGVGISKEAQEELFNIEKKTNIIDSSEKDGKGLGMILIKEFISKNGGEIWVESELNVGTTFYFTIPKAL
ncbi:MAG: ATP-binding protein [Salinivirgaceae bacterium]|jgi:two-component system sensor histidine kinase/response regulator|nr:ATP-binding protein [Salinivirgaceae bacterium]